MERPSSQDQISASAPLLRCLEALEQMMREERLATAAPRAGSEIELALVDDQMRPAMVNQAVLERSVSEVLTSELGSWNMEINLPPRTLPDAAADQTLEHDIRAAVAAAELSAEPLGARPVTVGILPTLEAADLTADWLTGDPRYSALDDRMRRARGRSFRLDIASPPAPGAAAPEQLRLDVDSVVPEAACTSLQLHLQLSVDSFPRYWNAAQAVAGAQVAVAANSPFLLGRHLWAETRVPLFTQAVDIRSDEQRLRGMPPRVWFGDRWTSSAFELFEQNVHHFELLLPSDDDEDPLASLAGGRTPSLGALCRHNSTIWRWNRPVYDVAAGVPHVRLENRVLPAAPTPVDAVADAMFFYGLVRTLAEQEHPVWQEMPFGVAEANFLAAAQRGVDASLSWPGAGTVPAPDLVQDTLLPYAYEGLLAWEVSPAAAERYLAVIEQRCRRRRTGATWQTATVADLERTGAGRGQALRQMLEDYLEGMKTNQPVHTW